MGGRMSARLVDAGYDLTVLDLDKDAVRDLEKKGAKAAASPREVAEQTDVVITSLPKPDAVRAVTLGNDGVAEGDRAKIVIDVSTTGSSAAVEVAAGLTAAGKQWVDSPVSGGVKGAENGTLALMVSCPKTVFETVEPVLTLFGKTFYVGENPGLAQVVKLANNMLSAGALLLTAEAMAMGVKAGADPRVMLDVINASSGRNSASQDKFPRAVLPRTFDFGFATELSYKDVRLCVDEAETLGVPMLGGGLIRQLLAITQAKYGPESDFTSIAKLIEEWSGVEIKG